MNAPRLTDRPDWFRREEIADGVHRVIEPCYRDDYRCNNYVVLGSQTDLLIDSGLGLGSLGAFLRPLTEDPLLVSTHAHYDHIGSNWEFSRRVIHPAEAEIVAAPTRQNTHADLLLTTEDFYSLPWPGFTVADWSPLPAPATGLLNEGDLLDLGDRHLTVLHTPGHSWGSLCLWDEPDGSLFCGDTVYDGELFDFLPCSDVATYVRTLQRLRALPVRTAYPGHGPVLGGRRFRAVIDEYLREKA